MEDILGAFIAIVGMAIHLCIQLVGATLGSGVMASRRRGLSRWGYLLMMLACGYFVFGILRFAVPALATPGLYGIYSLPVFLAAIVVFFVGAILAGAAQPDPQPRQSEGPIATLTEDASIHSIVGFGLVLVIGIVLFATSSLSTARHQSTLRDRACDIYEERVSEGLRDTASAARDLAERLLNRQIAPDITCSEDADS